MMHTLATPSAGATPGIAKSRRVVELDLLRGLVIVLMALDHVRDFLHADAFQFNPLDPERTTAMLYATRWITHLCAPAFVLLAGVSAYLQLAQGKARPRLSRFLFTRGLWFIFLELTLLSFGWSFAFPYALFLQVIWAIGWSMVALAGLVWLPCAWVLMIGVALVAGHNLLDPLTAEQFGAFAQLWVVLHEGGLITAAGTPIGFVAYPLLPWIGVIALGYGLGAQMSAAPPARDRLLLGLAALMLMLFVALRLPNFYGNASPWVVHDTFGGSLMSFLDVSKYPPSLHFLLVTLGIVLALLPLLARLRGPVARVLSVFGSVPFFFYLLHVYLVHTLAIAANALLGRDTSGLFGYMANLFMAPELLRGLGFPLPGVYVAWLVVLALLYLPCRWWADLKARRRDWWLSYL